MDWNKKLGYQKVSSAVTSAMYDNNLSYEEILVFITDNFANVTDSQTGVDAQND